jgi:hypothetical protein
MAGSKDHTDISPDNILKPAVESLMDDEQQISYLLRPSNRCKSQRIRSMMLNTLSVVSEEGRW